MAGADDPANVAVSAPPSRHLPLRESYTFPPAVIDQIHGMADEGRYEIRGWGAKRKLPTFDDLVFITAS